MYYIVQLNWWLNNWVGPSRLTLSGLGLGMFPGFEKIIEDRILQAQKNGEFDDLPGAGKPLDIADDSWIPEDLRLSYKILKNADCTPPEIELKKEILQTETLLATMPETEESYRLLKKLNFLIMKFNTLRSGLISFEMPQQYREKLTDRFAGLKCGQAAESPKNRNP